MLLPVSQRYPAAEPRGVPMVQRHPQAMVGSFQGLTPGSAFQLGSSWAKKMRSVGQKDVLLLGCSTQVCAGLLDESSGQEAPEVMVMPP